MQNVLDNEWQTIDTSIHRLDISTKLEDEINNHIYLKFSVEKFTCLKNGSVSLPVSSVFS